MPDTDMRLLLNDEQKIHKKLVEVINLFEARKKAILEKRWTEVNNIDLAMVQCLGVLAFELKTNVVTINTSPDVTRDLFADILREEVNRAKEKENRIQVG